MATYTNKLLFSGYITGSTLPATLYTVPPNTTTIVSSIRMTNISASNTSYSSFRMFIVSQSATAVSGNAIHWDTEIRPKTGFTDMSAYVMPLNYTLQAHCTGSTGGNSSSAAYISGIEIT